ncbi:unnamed protein product [Lactuca saligna]|uniref:Uncharacterized protein n=1 Tax=Lactuca saligna TaxID=75948 RepID=A0AA35ZJS1_LACSI|nr:unnamed protein product [Lactuca saligna]
MSLTPWSPSSTYPLIGSPRHPLIGSPLRFVLTIGPTSCFISALNFPPTAYSRSIGHHGVKYFVVEIIEKKMKISYSEFLVADFSWDRSRVKYKGDQSRIRQNFRIQISQHLGFAGGS